jgi:hypothetical protein
MISASSTVCRARRSRRPIIGRRVSRAKYGEGATELDALEALYPGVLRQILVGEIERYIDAGLDSRAGIPPMIAAM